MIPIRDSAAPRRFTAATCALIAVNLAVFAYELSIRANLNQFVARYAMIPAHVADLATSSTAPAGGWPGAIIAAASVFTAMFVHAGFWHIAGNMLYLFIFGAAVEYRMGTRRFVIFYFASGVAAAAAMIAISPSSEVPMIGASGAIAGVLGAYFILYPRGRITTGIPLLVFIEVPAVIYLLLWFGVQLCAGLIEQSGGGAAAGVAWWAHIGGFLFGMAAGPMMARVQKRRRRTA